MPSPTTALVLHMHRHPAARLAWCLIGAGAGISLALYLVGPPNTPFVLASLGGSSIFLFGLTRAPAAQLRAIVGGHLGGACIGIACAQFLGSSLLAYALAVSLSLGFMLATRTVHPPAGANPVIMVYAQAHWWALLNPVLLGGRAWCAWQWCGAGSIRAWCTTPSHRSRLRRRR